MIVMQETKDGYRASEVPTQEIFAGLLIFGGAANGVFTTVLGPTARAANVAPLVAWSVTAMAAVSLWGWLVIAAWRRKPWIEIDHAGHSVRWGRGTREPDESAVARFEVERLQGAHLYRLFAVRPDGMRVAMLPDWEAPAPDRLDRMARRLNDLTRD